MTSTGPAASSSSSSNPSHTPPTCDAPDHSQSSSKKSCGSCTCRESCGAYELERRRAEEVEQSMNSFELQLAACTSLEDRQRVKQRQAREKKMTTADQERIIQRLWAKANEHDEWIAQQQELKLEQELRELKQFKRATGHPLSLQPSTLTNLVSSVNSIPNQSIRPASASSAVTPSSSLDFATSLYYRSIIEKEDHAIRMESKAKEMYPFKPALNSASLVMAAEAKARKKTAAPATVSVTGSQSARSSSSSHSRSRKSNEETKSNEPNPPPFTFKPKINPVSSHLAVAARNIATPTDATKRESRSVDRNHVLHLAGSNKHPSPRRQSRMAGHLKKQKELHPFTPTLYHPILPTRTHPEQGIPSNRVDSDTTNRKPEDVPAISTASIVVDASTTPSKQNGIISPDSPQRQPPTDHEPQSQSLNGSITSSSSTPLRPKSQKVYPSSDRQPRERERGTIRTTTHSRSWSATGFRELSPSSSLTHSPTLNGFSVTDHSSVASTPAATNTDPLHHSHSSSQPNLFNPIDATPSSTAPTHPQTQPSHINSVSSTAPPQPTIQPSPRVLNQQVPLVRRSLAWQLKQAERLAVERLKRDQAAIEQCTFEPKINPPIKKKVNQHGNKRTKFAATIEQAQTIAKALLQPMNQQPTTASNLHVSSLSSNLPVEVSATVSHLKRQELARQKKVTEQLILSGQLRDSKVSDTPTASTAPPKSSRSSSRLTFTPSTFTYIPSHFTPPIDVNASLGYADIHLFDSITTNIAPAVPIRPATRPSTAKSSKGDPVASTATLQPLPSASSKQPISSIGSSVSISPSTELSADDGEEDLDAPSFHHSVASIIDGLPDLTAMMARLQRRLEATSEE